MADTPDLSQLDARLTRMEAQLGRLTELLDQAMPAIAIGIDIVDEEVAAAQARGIDVDARLRAAAELLERASEPAALDALGRMVEQAERLAPLTEIAAGAMDHVAMGIDIMDEEVAAAQARGIDVDERLRRAVGLVEKLTDPKVLDNLERALAHSELLGDGAELAASATGYTAIAIDVLDEEVAALQASGLDVDMAARNALELGRILTGWLASPAAQQLLGSGLLKPQSLNRITQLSVAVVQTLNEEPENIGPWGSFMRTLDTRFQRFAGFSFALAHRVGGLLGPEHGRLTTTIHD